MGFIRKILLALLIAAAPAFSAQAQTLLGNIGTNTSIPIPGSSCLYVAQWNGTAFTDSKFCPTNTAGWVAAIGLGSLSTQSSVNLSSQATGTLQAAQFPALSGAVTTPGGSLATSLASNAVATANIAAGAVTYAKIQNESPLTILCNPNGAALAPQECTLSGLVFSGAVLGNGLSGLTLGQVPVAGGGGNTLVSSVPFGTTGANTLVQTTAGGLIANALIANLPSTSMSATGVGAGSCTGCNLTYDAAGRILTAATGAGGGGISGMAPGQVAVAGTPTTITSSQPFGTTGNNVLVETNGSGLIANSLISGLPNANLANSSVTIAGHVVALGAANQPIAFGDLTGSIAAAQMLALTNGSIYQGNSLGQPAVVTISAAIDAAIGSTRGSLLERGVAGWALLGPGATVGNVLTSAGAGADPSYQLISYTLAPGLASNTAAYNTGTQVLLNNGTLSLQLNVEAHATPYTVLSTDGGKILTATANGVTFTAPVPTGTASPAFQFGYNGVNAYNLTAGGATIYGCGTAGATTISGLNAAAQLFPDATGKYQCTGGVNGGGAGNITGSGSTTAGNFLCSNNTGANLTTAVDCAIAPDSIDDPTGTSTFTATQWVNNDTLVVTAAAQTITAPATSALARNGNIWVAAIAAVTLQANAADVIQSSAGTTATGGNIILPAGSLTQITAKVSGTLKVAGNSLGIISAALGGTGQNSSAVTGIPQVNAGVWSFPTTIPNSATTTLNQISSGTTNTLASITTTFTTEEWLSSTTGAKTDNIPGCVAGINKSYLIEVDGQNTAAIYPITVTPASGTIGPNGTASYTMGGNGNAVVFQCDGAATAWRVVASNAPGVAVRYASATTLTIGAGDNGNQISQSNVAAVAATIGQAGSAGFPLGAYQVMLLNTGAGAITITPTTSTINGNATFVVPAGTPALPTGALLVADTVGNYTATLWGAGGGGSGCTVSGAAGIVLNTGSSTCQTDTAALLSAGQLSLGSSGVLGSIIFGNATSGTLNLQPVGGVALSGTLFLPNATDTLVGRSTADSLANKTLVSAALSSGSFSGTFTGNFTLSGNVVSSGSIKTTQVAGAPCALTPGATIAVNATCGGVQTVTLGQNSTLLFPTGLITNTNQIMLFEAKQPSSGGPFTLALGSGYSPSAINLNPAPNSVTPFSCAFDQASATAQCAGGGTFLAQYTIAAGANQIPACGAATEGMLVYVTDGAASPVYNAIQTGGGTTPVPVFCDGSGASNWRNH